MPVSVIPFSMPEPMEIPDHIVDMLRQMPPDQAVEKAMELLLEIDVAEAMVFERNDADGYLALAAVIATDGDRKARLEQLLRQGGGPGLAESAQEQRSALLVMGQVDGNEKTLPAGLESYLLAGGNEGGIGFLYVLPLAAKDTSDLGVLTLIRPPAAGPLNHEQPNITERVRQVLCEVLESSPQ